MRSCFRWIAVLALGVGLLGGCSDDPGPTGGTGGTPECASPEDCDDDGDECTAALCTEGTCQTTPLDDGAVCTEGECHQGACTPVFPCTEQGIRDAIAEGGGPHFFDCVGPTTVETETEILIDNDVILDGEGELTVDGKKQDHRVFQVENGVETELRGITVTGGVSASDGGGIFNRGTLTLTNSTVSGNTARDGGGIFNLSDLTLTNSTVSGNTAADLGGGIFNLGDLTLTNSTLSGNTADRGGGICNFGDLTLTNGTVSGNTARVGGGIFNLGDLTLTNSTVSGNTADSGDGIYAGTGAGVTSLTNSLIDGDCQVGDPDVAITSNGHNIESPGDTCGFDQGTDQVDVTEGQLNLGRLQDNGGPTMTQALLPGSVAIDVVPADMCEVDEDQRGEPRDSMCDVGAFEVQP